MTTPGQGPPEGAWEFGDDWGQNYTEQTVLSTVTQGAVSKWNSAEDQLQYRVIDPIANNYTLAVSAKGSADQAVTAAQAAVNAANNAETYADRAYKNASFWIIECVVASAEVLLGVNELLLGPVLNVPDDQDALLTDVHIALLEQHDGMTIEIRKWDAEGTTSTTVATAVLDPNQTRANVRLLEIPVLDKERFYYYVTNVVGSVPPTVLQCAVAGNYTPIGEQI